MLTTSQSQCLVLDLKPTGRESKAGDSLPPLVIQVINPLQLEYYLFIYNNCEPRDRFNQCNSGDGKTYKQQKIDEKTETECMLEHIVKARLEEELRIVEGRIGTHMSGPKCV